MTDALRPFSSAGSLPDPPAGHGLPARGTPPVNGQLGLTEAVPALAATPGLPLQSGLWVPSADAEYAPILSELFPDWDVGRLVSNMDSRGWPLAEDLPDLENRDAVCNWLEASAWNYREALLAAGFDYARRFEVRSAWGRAFSGEQTKTFILQIVVSYCDIEIPREIEGMLREARVPPQVPRDSFVRDLLPSSQQIEGMSKTDLQFWQAHLDRLVSVFQSVLNEAVARWARNAPFVANFPNGVSAAWNLEHVGLWKIAESEAKSETGKRFTLPVALLEQAMQQVMESQLVTPEGREAIRTLHFDLIALKVCRLWIRTKIEKIEKIEEIRAEEAAKEAGKAEKVVATQTAPALSPLAGDALTRFRTSIFTQTSALREWVSGSQRGNRENFRECWVRLGSFEQHLFSVSLPREGEETLALKEEIAGVRGIYGALLTTFLRRHVGLPDLNGAISARSAPSSPAPRVATYLPTHLDWTRFNLELYFGAQQTEWPESLSGDEQVELYKVIEEIEAEFPEDPSRFKAWQSRGARWIAALPGQGASPDANPQLSVLSPTVGGRSTAAGALKATLSPILR